MKKTLFLLFFIFSFFITAPAYAHYYKHFTFTYLQLKKMTRLIAKRAGFHVRFIPKTSNYIGKCRTAKFRGHYGCVTLYGYETKFLYGQYKNPRHYIPIPLTKTIYRQIFFNFVSKYFFFISPYAKNSYYVVGLNSGVKGFDLFSKYRWNNGYIAPSFLPTGIRVIPKGMLEKWYMSGQPYSNRNFLIVLPPKVFNYLLHFKGDRLITINHKLQLTNNNYSANNSYSASESRIANMIYKKAKSQIKTGSIFAKNTKTFGFSKAGLRLLMFNITDPEYLRAAQESLQPIMSGSNATAVGQIGTSTLMASMQFLQGIANANASANSSLENIYSRFMNISSNKKYLYDSVDGYYTKALTGRYGELKTSFLQSAGIAHETDISYITILQKANLFLDFVNQNKQNLNVFDYLFNKNFKPGIGTEHTSYYPNVTPVEKVFITTANGLFMNMTTLNMGIYSELGLLTQYTEPTLNTVNFYSLTYYLIKNLHSRNTNPEAKKLFKYIILGKYKTALKLLKIDNTVQSKGNKIDKFWHYVSLKKYKKALKAVSKYNECSSSMSIVKSVAKKADEYCKIWSNLQIIVLYHEFNDLKHENMPWDKSKKKADINKMLELNQYNNY